MMPRYPAPAHHPLNALPALAAVLSSLGMPSSWRAGQRRELAIVVIISLSWNFHSCTHELKGKHLNRFQKSVNCLHIRLISLLLE